MLREDAQLAEMKYIATLSARARKCASSAHFVHVIGNFSLKNMEIIKKFVL